MKVEALKVWGFECGTTVTPGKNSRRRGRVPKETKVTQSKNYENISPYSLYPYIGKYNRADPIESKKQAWINGQISSWKHEWTQVHSKLHHITL